MNKQQRREIIQEAMKTAHKRPMSQADNRLTEAYARISARRAADRERKRKQAQARKEAARALRSMEDQICGHPYCLNVAMPRSKWCGRHDEVHEEAV